MANLSEAEFVRRLAQKTGKSVSDVKRDLAAEHEVLRQALKRPNDRVKRPYLGTLVNYVRKGGERRRAPNGTEYVTKTKRTIKLRLSKRIKALFGF